MPGPKGEALRRLIPSLLLLLLAPACSTLEIPVEPPEFHTSDFVSADREGIEILAKPIQGIDSYLELFDDNLPEIGIAAVWVIVRNLRPEEISLVNARWDLRVKGGKHSALAVSEIFSFYYKRRSIRLYSQYLDKRERADLDKLMLKVGRIQPGQERGGLLFFKIVPVLSAAWTPAAVLGVRDVRFARHRKANIEVPLSYANP